MHIHDVSFIRLDLNLKQPYTIAYETIASATNYILKITTSEGNSGYGCAAPDEVVTGEDPRAVEHVISSKVLPYLDGKNPYQRGELMSGLLELIPKNMSVLCMVDMALYDLLARKAKLPLYQVLGGYRSSIATSVTIGILPAEETLEEAKRIMANGFKIIKVKGGLSLDGDLERIRLLRTTLGPQLVLRFDANQGYTPAETMKFIKEAKASRVEILEQPVAIGVDMSETEHYSDARIPIMADESLKSLRDAFRIAKNEAIDMINIKLQKVGGITPGMHINSVSKAAGNDVMVGCLDECALGISAGLHFALSRPNVKYADLDAHMDFQDDPFSNLFSIKEGVMYPKIYPGLGQISPDILDLF